MKTKIYRKLLITFIIILSAGLIFPDKPMVYLIGDSTMAPKREDRRPETGWGEKLPQFFNSEIKFENRARNGRSTKSFMAEGRWDSVVNVLSQGDYVFIQFGHNDQSKHKVERYTPPEDYKKNLIKFVKDVRSKEATPVLLTPVMRRRFDDEGKFYDVHGVYPDLVREVAAKYEVILVDHHKLTEKVLIDYGEKESKQLYLHLKPGENENYPEGLTDDTHFSPGGAELAAKLVIDTLKQMNTGLEKFIIK